MDSRDDLYSWGHPIYILVVKLVVDLQRMEKNCLCILFCPYMISMFRENFIFQRNGFLNFVYTLLISRISNKSEYHRMNNSFKKKSLKRQLF